MRLAAIDLGSNSFRLEIARVEKEVIISEGSWKETVRLAGGIDSEGNLTEEAQERALKALARIAEKIEGFPRSQIRAVGTQTLRSAKNSREFIERAEKVLGCKIEILRGKEEARLVYEGCSFALRRSDKKRLIVDIGGASTECVIGHVRDVLEADSFHVGCVNTSVAFFKNGIITPAMMQKAQLSAEAEFDSSIEKFFRCGWQEAFGSSGTASAVSLILHDQGWTDGTITLEALLKLKYAMLEFGNTSSFKFLGMKDDRREVLAGGVCVLLAIFNKFKLKSMKPADGALRYGILYDLAGRKLDKDPRAASVHSLMLRMHVDEEQASRVARVAEELYKKIEPSASPEELKELAWAADLHEIGLSLSRSDYHKHSEYLIRNSDIPGFSRSEQEKLAAIVLAHRGNLKKVASFLADRSIAEKILALRLAVILCHAKIDTDLPPIQLFSGADGFMMSIPKNWLTEHPLTEYLLGQEKEIWAKVGIKFEIYTR